jgi:hypothetical protein
VFEANRFVSRGTLESSDVQSPRIARTAAEESNSACRYPQKMLKDLLIRPGDRDQVLERAADSSIDPFACVSSRNAMRTMESLAVEFSRDQFVRAVECLSELPCLPMHTGQHRLNGKCMPRDVHTRSR